MILIEDYPKLLSQEFHIIDIAFDIYTERV